MSLARFRACVMQSAVRGQGPSFKNVGAGNVLSYVFLLALSVGAIGEIFSDQTFLRIIEAACFVGFAVTERRRLTMMARSLALLSVVMALTFVSRGRLSVGDILNMADRAAYMAYLLIAMSVLQAVATRSAMFQRAGEVLVCQTAGKRYLLTSLGAVAFGFLLNIGTIGLLGSMISSGRNPDAGSEKATAEAKRKLRGILAVLRGFSFVPMWSPVSVAMVLVTIYMPSVSYGNVALITAPLGLVLVLLGWGLDRLAPTDDPTDDAQPPALRQIFPALGVVLSVPILAAGIALLFSVRFSSSVLVAAPLIAVAWAGLQMVHERQTARLDIFKIGSGVAQNVVGLRSEIVIFSSATFIGGVLAQVVDMAAFLDAMNGLGLTGSVALVAFAWAAVGAAVLGLSPIIGLSLLAGLLPQAEALAISPVSMAVMLVFVWSSAICIAPYSAPVRLSARVIGGNPWHVGLISNGLYGLLSMGLFSAICIWLD